MNAQVNVQTGSAVFGVPMFNWQDDKSRLHVNVAINYNSGNGLKVNEVASNVGQGWNLLAGGSVTRMQVGEPDDQYAYNGDGTIEDEQQYPAGNLYNTDDVYTKGCPKSLARYPLFEDKNHVYKQHNVVAKDRELDYFAFNFNGKSGLFVLNKYDDSTGYLLGNGKVKIRFQLSSGQLSQGGKNIRTRISTFTIQDEDGLIYRFGTYNSGSTAFGLSKALRVGYCDADRSQMLKQPQFKGNHVYYQSLFDDDAGQYPYVSTVNPWVINSWYLTEIDDPLTGRQILFNYNVHNVNSVGESTISYYKENDYSVIMRRYTMNVVQDIKSITCEDQYTISFQYQANQRYDLNGEYALSSVTVKASQFSSRTVSRYDLNTKYFIYNRYGTPSNDYEQKAARLCLLSVKKYSPDLKAEEQPYLFDYYLGSNSSDDFVPPPFFPAKDIWGFYNGLNATAYNNAALVNKPLSQLTLADLDNNDCKGLCFLKNNISGAVLNAKDHYAQNGLLKQIVYPTGGTLTYTYTQNVGRFEGESTVNTVGGVSVSKTRSTGKDCNDSVVTNYNYVLSGSSTSSLWGIERPVNIKMKDGNPVAIQNHYHADDRQYKWVFPAGKYYFLYQYPGILSQQDAASLTWHQQFMAVLSQVLNAVSIVMQVMDVINVILGPTPLGWVAVIIDIIGGLYILFATLWANPDKDFTSTVYYNSDLNGVNPLPAQYRRVEIIPNTGDVGKTVETFTSPYDENVNQRYALWMADNPDFLMQQRFAYWAYGLPRITTTFDASGIKIKEVENIYDFSFASMTLVDFKLVTSQKHPVTSCNCQVLKSTSQKIPDWDNPAIYDNQTTPGVSYITTSNSDLNIFRYDALTGEVLLDTTYERTYKQGSNSVYLTTVTSYEYGNPSSNYLYARAITKIVTTQSNGNTNYKYINYSGNYAYTGGVFQTMANNNIYYIPVETQNEVYSGSQYLTLNEQVTEFIRVANGDIKPSRTLEQRFTSPQLSPYLYEGLNTDYSHYKQLQKFTYDASSNLIGIKDEGNHAVANIYDYAGRFVTGTVINADPAVDKPAFSSFETDQLGGWVLTGTASYNSSKAATGARSFILASGISLKASGLNNAKPYKLSFWSIGSGVSIATTGGSAALTFTGPTYNGLTYYEYNIAQGASAVTVTGSTSIDELRIYPANARMRTTTFDPLIGKTSECDENNRITYYQYDESARLRFIKDEKKNIVKMYEYNVVSNKQGGCPGTYTNHLITEVFTRNNCASGYQGTAVTYTVPAGKYSSTISQADADMKAENEINASSQAAANSSGACSIIFYNHGKTQPFTTEGCADNQAAGTVNYVVPAHKYSSTISQDFVDSLEQDEIDANGQANANSAGNRVCTISNAPNWIGDSTAATRCQKDASNNNTGHWEVLMKQVNPNCTNPAYGSTAWKDMGIDTTGACPIPACSASTCTGEGRKCINGNCELGQKIVTGTSYDGIHDRCFIYYYYKWSDGSQSTGYNEVRPGQCN